MSANQERERLAKLCDEQAEAAEDTARVARNCRAADIAATYDREAADYRAIASLLRESAPDTPRFTTADASAFMEWWHKQEWTPDAFTKVADWLNRRRVSLPAAPRQDTPDLSRVTRFEVIDHRAGAQPFGRVYSEWGVAVSLSYQDGGRTLKVFVDDPAEVSGE